MAKDQIKYAAELLQNPVWHDVIERMEAHLYELWLEADSVTKREQIWRKVDALRSMHGEIEGIIQFKARANP